MNYGNCTSTGWPGRSSARVRRGKSRLDHEHQIGARLPAENHRRRVFRLGGDVIHRGGERMRRAVGHCTETVFAGFDPGSCLLRHKEPHFDIFRRQQGNDRAARRHKFALPVQRVMHRAAAGADCCFWSNAHLALSHAARCASTAACAARMASSRPPSLAVARSAVSWLTLGCIGVILRPGLVQLFLGNDLRPAEFLPPGQIGGG